MTLPLLTQTREYQSLKTLAGSVADLPTLFSEDAQRTEKYAVEFGDLYFDYSKQRITDEIQSALIDLAHARELPKTIKRMFAGEVLNTTEQRPVLHVALRMPKEKSLMVDGVDVVQQVHTTLDKIESIVEQLHKGEWKGHTGKAITDVVNIGVGGSDLGPVMAVASLKEWTTSPVVTHFVSNMDGSQLNELLKVLDPETTLFVLCTKSFTTSDTFGNVNTALSWLSDSLSKQQGEEISVEELKKTHLIGVSAKADKMTEWGIPETNQLVFWAWVGGRYSFWSGIGFSIALTLGMDTFREILAGAHEMDEHFASTEDFSQNIPVLLGLLGVWNSTFMDIGTHAVMPYDARLRYLPNYLTQLEMESNGKHTTFNDELITDYHTCPILWGDVGTNGQHAFYQLLHQGTETVACDFVATINRYKSGVSKGAGGQEDKFAKLHQNSLANCLAQSRVLAFGNTALENDTDRANNPHKDYRGNQPSTTMLFDELTPRMLGKLIALYEHKVFVMGTIWNINSFDQWGVELGKIMAKQVDKAIDDKQVTGFDTSTNELLRRVCG